MECRQTEKHVNEGFTLVEVLVAMVILLVGVLAISAMQLTAVNNNKVSEEVVQETKIAQEDLENRILQDAGDFPSADYSVSGLSGDLQKSEIDVSLKKHGISVEKTIPYLKSSVGMKDEIK